MSEPLLSVENLRISFHTEAGAFEAVRGISFAIAEGESLCVVGESGCGKSLTALALMGLLPKGARMSADHIRFRGAELSPRALAGLRGREIAMIFQDPMSALNPTLTIGQQLCEGVIARGVPREDARRRALDLLARVGLAQGESRLAQYPHHLSGGQRQRIMIAMALMAQPKLLIADEPTTALDVTIQAQILHLLKEIDRELSLSLLLITHDLGVVAGIADRVAVMYAGRIVEQRPVMALFHAPLHPYTRGLIDCIPVPGETRPGSLLSTIAGQVPSLIGEIKGCAFAARCPRALPACAAWQPEPTRLADGTVECLRAGEPT